MRRLIVSNLMSLDGFLSGPNGELDWFVSPGFPMNTEYGTYVKDLISSVGGMLLGRRTYEEFASYWPTATDNDPDITEKMNVLPKYVFSKTLDRVEWGKWGTAFLVKGDAAAEAKKLKEEPGRDLAIYGSGQLVSALMKAGLVDEIQAFVQPWILGQGRGEFVGLTDRYELELIKATPFKSGAVGLFYRPRPK